MAGETTPGSDLFLFYIRRRPQASPANIARDCKPLYLARGGCMGALPTGTVTFLFTDIEGSTALLPRLGDRRYAEILTKHHPAIRAKGTEAPQHV